MFLDLKIFLVFSTFSYSSWIFCVFESNWKLYFCRVYFNYFEVVVCWLLLISERFLPFPTFRLNTNHFSSISCSNSWFVCVCVFYFFLQTTLCLSKINILLTMKSYHKKLKSSCHQVTWVYDSRTLFGSWFILKSKNCFNLRNLGFFFLSQHQYD